MLDRTQYHIIYNNCNDIASMLSYRAIYSIYIDERSTDKLCFFLCNTIARFIESCLLYVPAKFQGLKTNKTRATSNFL